MTDPQAIKRAVLSVVIGQTRSVWKIALSAVVDAACILFLTHALVTGEMVFWLHLTYIGVGLAAFIRGGGLPTAARATVVTLVAGGFLLTHGDSMVMPTVGMTSAAPMRYDITSDMGLGSHLLMIPMMYIFALLCAVLAHRMEKAVHAQNRKVHDLELLLGVSHELASCFDLETVHAAVPEAAARLLAQQNGESEMRASIVRVNEGVAEIVGAYDPGGREPTPVGTRRSVNDDPLVRSCVDSSDVLTVTRIEHESGVSTGRACAPIFVSGESYGVLAIEGVRHEFSSVELTYLKGVADLAGLAIGNARSYQHVAAMAVTDELTGLANRRNFGVSLDKAVSTSGLDQQVSILMVDMDGFKHINDSLGHAAGDRLLQEVAMRLRAATRENDLVARLGGDEFAILPSTPMGTDGATRIAHKLLLAMEAPFTIEGKTIEADLSIGIASYPDHGDDAPTLIRRADVAMYIAKRGRRGYAAFSKGDDAHSDRVSLMGELRQAIENGELVLHFQPEVELVSGRVIGVEALVRWQHPSLGLLAPDRFIQAAEQTDMIRPLTRAVLDAALRQLSVWRSAGVDLSMAVNVSGRNIHDVQLPGTVATLLKRWNVPASALTLEVSEGTTWSAAAMTIADRLISTGVRLSIDDYGAGLTSLAHLSHGIVNELKIDQSLIQALDASPYGSPIVKSTIDLAHNLGLTVVAEGVELEATLSMLRTFGCDLAQGYLLSRPQPADGLTFEQFSLNVIQVA